MPAPNEAICRVCHKPMKVKTTARNLPGIQAAPCLKCLYERSVNAGGMRPINCKVPTAGLFPPGEVFWGKVTMGRLKADQAADLLARHVAGDFGNVGRIASPADVGLTQKERDYWPDLPERLKLNAACLQLDLREGDIRSSYRVQIANLGEPSIWVATCPQAQKTLVYLTDEQNLFL